MENTLTHEEIEREKGENEHNEKCCGNENKNTLLHL